MCHVTEYTPAPRGGDFAYKSLLMFIRKFGIGKFGIKTPEGDQSWWAQNFLPLKETRFMYFYISLHETRSETFTATYGLQMTVFSPEHPK